MNNTFFYETEVVIIGQQNIKPSQSKALYRVTFFFLIIVVMIFCGMNLAAAQISQTEKTVTISVMDNVQTHIVATEVVREAYRRIGYKVVFDYLPARRALIWANEGKTDGDVARILKTEKKFPNIVRVPTPVVSFVGVTYTRKIEKDIHNWNDLKGLSIGVIRGMRYSKKISTHHKKILKDMAISIIFFEDFFLIIIKNNEYRHSCALPAIFV